MITAFSRFVAFMSAVSSIGMAETIATMGRYKSRGKGGRGAHTASGVRRIQRAAEKARNVKRNRLAHR